jgi:hypothetical protein
MWTCPTCGEQIEDQFDACWKCASQANMAEPIELPPLLPAGRNLRWFNYLIAAAAAYASTVGAFFLCWLMQSLSAVLEIVDLPPVQLWLWMALPAAITFIVVFPFLRFPIPRRVVLLCVCLGWVIIGSTFGRAKTRGDQACLSGGFNNSVQATPVCAFLLFLSQVPGAPDDNHWAG